MTLRALRLALLDEILPRHLQRRFDRLRAAADEIDVREPVRRILDQRVGQSLGDLGGEEAGVGVGELVELRMQRGVARPDGRGRGTRRPRRPRRRCRRGPRHRTARCPCRRRRPEDQARSAVEEYVSFLLLSDCVRISRVAIDSAEVSNTALRHSSDEHSAFNQRFKKPANGRKTPPPRRRPLLVRGQLLQPPARRPLGLRAAGVAAGARPRWTRPPGKASSAPSSSSRHSTRTGTSRCSAAPQRRLRDRSTMRFSQRSSTRRWPT